MRIGITCYPTYGGSGIVATELGLELAARGHEIHFITYANPIRLDPGTPRIHYHEVEVSNYPLFQYPPYCLALASRMAEVAERYDLDLLHVHYAIPHSISAMLAQQMLAPAARVCRSSPLCTAPTSRWWERTAPTSRSPSSRSSNPTGSPPSASTCAATRSTSSASRTKSDVIHNFVNCDIYRPDPGARRPREKLLMHISNFRPVKRVLDCVRILAEVRKRRPGAPDDGRRRADAGSRRDLARELGVEEHVTFLGKQDHVERLFPQAHVLLMPSEMESFGLAALEAMACGVPPVATRVGGVPELIDARRDGFLEPVGDVERRRGA